MHFSEQVCSYYVTCAFINGHFLLKTKQSQRRLDRLDTILLYIFQSFHMWDIFPIFYKSVSFRSVQHSIEFLAVNNFSFLFCSEKNHPHLQASSRRGNKLKRRKAYYNRQRKDISVSQVMISTFLVHFVQLYAIAQFCLVPTWSLPLATHGQPPSSQMTLNVQAMVRKWF